MNLPSTFYARRSRLVASEGKGSAGAWGMCAWLLFTLTRDVVYIQHSFSQSFRRSSNKALRFTATESVQVQNNQETRPLEARDTSILIGNDHDLHLRCV